MHSIYKKETPARIKGERVENETKLHLSKLNSNVVSMAKFYIYGRETNQPMRCIETEATRLDLPVTKFKDNVHHPNGARGKDNQQTRGGITE